MQALDRALARGDMEAFRRGFFGLDQQGRTLLEMRLGRERVERLYARARRRRGPRQGRVLVLHGIMGSELETVDKSGDENLIWISYVRLALGRLARLTLGLDGQQADPEYSVKLGGLLTDYYLPLILELDNRWDVRPFAFDWRLDIDVSARRLAGDIKGWAKGAPAHIVVHSMGGLVARRFVQLFPDIWKSMADPDGRGRGGRLVMLGTPNRGALEVPLVLTGEQQTVKMLARLDPAHDLPELLEIIGTFLGCYQMLPSPKLDFGDDRKRLFDEKTWGRFPVHQPLLDSARALQEQLHPVIDPDRLLYVAGYDRETAYRIRVDAPGRFSYQQTLDGDGKVPHELGLLPGVRTFWVKEVHGDLPKNENVLAGIHDLLATGSTAALEPARPVRRAVEEPQAWIKAPDVDRIPPEFEALIAGTRRGDTRAVPTLGPSETAQVEALLIRPFLGGPGATRAPGGSPGPRGRGRPVPARRTPRPRLPVEVVWGDITRVPGDIYAVGHYQGVPPQFAEHALDLVISGVKAGASARASRENLVLTSLTRRGVLRGALGDIDFYPWAERPERIVAVAGMGHPGRFGATELRLLARNLTWAITSLPRVRTVCAVLIGSGAGNLAIPSAVDGLLAGMVEALGQVEGRAPIQRVRLVEKDLAKAHQIHRHLIRLQEQKESDSAVALQLGKEVRVYPNGSADGLTLALAAAIDAIGGSSRSPRRRALATVLQAVPVANGLRQEATRALEKLAENQIRRIEQLAASLDVSRRSEDAGRSGSGIPTRISFVTDGRNIRVAGLTETAVIPEREIGVDPKLVDEAIQSMTDPEPARVSDLSAMLGRLLVPRDFRNLLLPDGPFVFEVDRTMARVHWEMLSAVAESQAPSEPISIRSAFARQLRTTYSPAPAPDTRAPGALRALVVGDPGDPRAGHHLPGAEREALAVAKILKDRHGMKVLVMVGAPSAERVGLLQDVAPASRLAVLDQLMHGGFDLLHYCGHGDFDPADPTLTGWVFEGGLLTAREMERVDVAPRLVVANACLSGLTSEQLSRGQRVGQARTEADLLPSLADEFFCRGVRNYIGTAWEIDDAGAIEFATHLYDSLLGAKVTLGEAVRQARAALKASEQQFGALWAAYQHYGDPTFTLSSAAVTG